MKQTTKNILGVGAIILLSSGVAGLTTYKLLQSNESAKFGGEHLSVYTSMEFI